MTGKFVSIFLSIRLLSTYGKNFNEISIKAIEISDEATCIVYNNVIKYANSISCINPFFRNYNGKDWERKGEAMFSPKQKKTITAVIVVILIAMMVLTMILPPLLSRIKKGEEKKYFFWAPPDKGVASFYGKKYGRKGIAPFPSVL